jgi:serine/threonine protein kinase
LHELHKLGVIHRDIKPDNFLMQKQNDDTIRVVLSDFGLSTSECTEQAADMSNCGTASYKAPENILNKNHRSALPKEVWF